MIFSTLNSFFFFSPYHWLPRGIWVVIVWYIVDGDSEEVWAQGDPGRKCSWIGGGRCWNPLSCLLWSYFLASFTTNSFNVYSPNIFSQCDLRIPQAKKTFQGKFILFVHLRQSLVHNFQNSSYILTSYVPILCHVFAANWLLGAQNALKKKLPLFYLGS